MAAVQCGLPTMQVLIVEDNRSLSEILRQAIEEDGHVVTSAFDGKEGLSIATHHHFDVIVLDVMLPTMDGLAVLQSLRHANDRTPILILTARDTTLEQIRGLHEGADDYLTKPVSLDVLLARIRAVGRRGPLAQPVVARVADLELHTGTRDVLRGGVRIALTRTEYQLLELLMRNEGRVVPRETIVESIWGFDKSVEANTLDAFIRLLRNKIDQNYPSKLIQTVRGVGYCIRHTGLE